MGKNRLHKGHAISNFVDSFNQQLENFGVRERATKNINHRGAKGTERELALRDFFEAFLPLPYEAATGEAVDLFETHSPQMDVVIFDKAKNSPLYRGGYVVLPAEALLATVESKSRLTKGEIKKSCSAATSLKSLQPLKKKLVEDKLDNKTDAQRYFHSVFALGTDISKTNWAKKELDRFRGTPSQGRDIDLCYVLGRGLINLDAGTWIAEDAVTSQALISFYFSIYNFLLRENARRKPAPYFSYAPDINKFWKKI